MSNFNSQDQSQGLYTFLLPPPPKKKKDLNVYHKSAGFLNLAVHNKHQGSRLRIWRPWSPD